MMEMGAQEDLVKCPYCAEEIKAEALLCKHCGKDQSRQVKKRKDDAAWLETKKKLQALSEPNIDESKTGSVVCAQCGNEYFVVFDTNNVMSFPCSRCGQKNKRKQTTYEQVSNFSAVAFIAISFLCVFIFFKSCITGMSSVDKYEAYSVATQFVERRLKSPASAGFSGYDKNKVIKSGDNVFYVDGYVDAANSFGAVLRKKYTCKLTYLSDKGAWRCDYVSFDE